MKEVIRQGNRLKAIKKFKCKKCKTLFRSDEYSIGMGTGCTISHCPVCGEIAYKCFFG